MARSFRVEILGVWHDDVSLSAGGQYEAGRTEIAAKLGLSHCPSASASICLFGARLKTDRELQHTLNIILGQEGPSEAERHRHRRKADRSAAEAGRQEVD